MPKAKRAAQSDYGVKTATTTTNNDLNDARIREIADMEMREVLNQEYETRITRDKPWPPETLENHLTERWSIYTDLTDAIEHSDHSSVQR